MNREKQTESELLLFYNISKGRLKKKRIRKGGGFQGKRCFNVPGLGDIFKIAPNQVTIKCDTGQKTFLMTYKLQPISEQRKFQLSLLMKGLGGDGSSLVFLLAMKNRI